jgi:hypothetical protein
MDLSGAAYNPAPLRLGRWTGSLARLRFDRASQGLDAAVQRIHRQLRQE